MEQERKKRLIVSRVILVLCVLGGIGLGLLLSRGRGPKQTEKTFDADGLRITLASRFAETGDRGSYDRAYWSNREAVFVLRQAYGENGSAPGMSVEEFARVSAESLEASTEPRTENGLTTFYCVQTIDGAPYECMVSVCKGSDAFWLVFFACKQGSLEKYREGFLQFASTVVVP